jgi:hypothetical protein
MKNTHNGSQTELESRKAPSGGNMELKGQAVCKDCGNGTLSNEFNNQFEINDFNQAECVRCGSTHIDGELFLGVQENS